MEPYFVDLHVLGGQAEQIKAAVNAWRRHIKNKLAGGDGDIVGKASQVKPAEAPFPAEGLTCCAGAVFDGNQALNVDDEINKALKKVMSMPGITAGITVWWVIGDETAKFQSINSHGQSDLRMISGGEVFENALLEEQLMDSIGDQLLPDFLTPPPASLAPLYAHQRATELDQILPPPEDTRKTKPRV